MRSRLPRLLTPAADAAALAAGTGAAVAQDPATGDAGAPVAPNGALRCVAPTDASGIDAILRDAGSPLAGDGATIVEEGVRAGIDPRVVVAIAAHETLLMTYGPAARINNPFGLGPGMRFSDDSEAVRYAVRLLDRWYVGEGRSTLPLIGSKWAPVGALNDPRNLNANWTSGVGHYYAALGGDPYRPVLLARQDASPDCVTPASVVALEAGAGTPPPAAGSGPAVVVVWGGNVPEVSGRSAAYGADPVSGAPAGIGRFAFPVAVPADGGVRYARTGCEAHALCAVTIETAPQAHAVAATDGRLIAATPAERAEGIAFWIVREDGDRVGYGPLASYAPGVSHGATVAMGQPLGRSTGSLSVAWTRTGTPIDPYPLLTATRPSDRAPATP